MGEVRDRLGRSFGHLVGRVMNMRDNGPAVSEECAGDRCPDALSGSRDDGGSLSHGGNSCLERRDEAIQ
jgi:hypothetical protein